MINHRLKGTGVALVTPFTNDNEVDFQGLKKLLDFVIENGVDYLVVQGTTGESPTVTNAEKAQILDFVKENTTGKRPVIYGIGGNNTHEVVEFIHQSELSGVDAILSVSPYYNKPSQSGLLAHYRTIADASPVPVIIYNVPGRTSTNIEADTTIELSQHPNIVGIKEASGNLEQALRIHKYAREDFMLISGDDLMTLPLITMGGQGVISVLANAFPRIFSEMVNHALSGNAKEARKNLMDLVDINPLMYTEGNPVGVKYVLSCLQICSPYVRLPLCSPSEKLKNQIERQMEKIGVF